MFRRLTTLWIRVSPGVLAVTLTIAWGLAVVHVIDGLIPYEPMALVSDKPTNAIVLAGLLVMVMHFLQAGRKRETLPERRST
jgi:hypothetical protein